jgi:predicted phosphate transport protein (TIGR00153 family)
MSPRSGAVSKLLAGAPNQRAFFSLFEEAGRNIEASTALLDRLMREWPDGGALAAEIRDLEHEGDRITHDIIHRLNTTTVTPLDREDIFALAAALDDVVDYTEEAADFLGLYGIEAPMEQGLALTGVLRDCGRELSTALATLDDIGALSQHLVEVNRLENEGDRIQRQALASLFRGGIDPVVIIRWKDVYERLEQAVDSCEHAAHILEGIVVKQA